MARRRWTPEQDELLLRVRVTPHTERYKGHSAFADIARKLGVSLDAARSRYFALMRKNGRRGLWTRDGLWTSKEDDTVLRALPDPDHGRAPSDTWIDLGFILGRTPAAVRLRAYNLRKKAEYGTGGPG